MTTRSSIQLCENPLDSGSSDKCSSEASSNIYSTPHTPKSSATKTLDHSIDDNNNVSSSSMDQNLIVSKEFSWLNYLRDTKSTTVDQSQFRCAVGMPENFLLLESLKDYSKLQNPFKVGDCLEGVDPAHESLICPLKVIETSGYRIRLRFIGFSEKSDFWILANSPFIFPCGWCENNHRILQKFGCRETIKSWNDIVKFPNLRKAPKEVFTIPWDCTDEYYDGFDIGKKVEAVDRRNPFLTCVATIIDRIESYLLISFDGWNFAFDQWVHLTSKLIQPVGFCAKNKMTLSTPEGKPSIGFSWTEYLAQNNSEPVQDSSFTKIRHGTQRIWPSGSKLECVDIYFPFIIRPATVIDCDKSTGVLTLKYDGFPDYLDFCIDQDSSFLLPAGFSRATNDKLVFYKQTPNSSQLRKKKSSCAEKFCGGYGNQNVVTSFYHLKSTDCPYSRENRGRNRFLYSFRVKKNNIHYPYPRSLKKRGNEVTSKISSPIAVNSGEYSGYSCEMTQSPSTTRIGEKRLESLVEHENHSQSTPLYNNNRNTTLKRPRIASQEQSNRVIETISIPLDDVKPIIGSIPPHEPPLDQIPNIETSSRNCPSSNHLSALAENQIEPDNQSHTSDTSRSIVTTSNLQITPVFLTQSKNHVPVDSNFLDRLMPKTIDHKPNPNFWSAQDVGDYIASLPFCQEFAQLFTENEIDGTALMCLEKEDLMNMFKMKLGPAIKISTAINALRKEIMS